MPWSGTAVRQKPPCTAAGLQHRIEYLIDGGLLIKGNQISRPLRQAENTRLGAIKRALFSDPDHAAQIGKLAELKPERLLLASYLTAHGRCYPAKLGLPSLLIIFRSRILPRPRRSKPLDRAAKENRHVIPLPTAVKSFPGYIVAPLRSFSVSGSTPEKVAIERSIIRLFTVLWGTFISPSM